MQIAFISFLIIPPHKPHFQASSSPIPRIWICLLTDYTRSEDSGISELGREGALRESSLTLKLRFQFFIPKQQYITPQVDTSNCGQQDMFVTEEKYPPKLYVGLSIISCSSEYPYHKLVPHFT